MRGLAWRIVDVNVIMPACESERESVMSTSPQSDLPGAQRVAERFSMRGRRALVTGGSVSIGRAIALAFADAGADIAIHYSQAADVAFGKPGAAEETAADIRGRGRRAEVIEADFERSGEARRTVHAAEKALGGVDVLVVCASIQYRTPFDEVTAEQIERQIQINFRASVELLQAALPPMKARGWGRVLTLGSINETRPEPVLSIYAALKSAQHNLAINLARQCAAFGVTVNNLSPGLVATERNRWRRVDAGDWAKIEREANPMGRAGTPEEMAGAALLLCSDAGSFITGADLQATGGKHL
jgi:NAD(P)-dependent dehydrogenase (short-subunit alcohol dehydrogenase family)